MRNSRFYQIQRGAYQIMRADGNLRNVFAQHIGGNGNDFVFLVDTDFGRAAVLMNGAHFGNAGGNGLVIANRHFNFMFAEHAGNNRRRNTHGTNDDAGFVACVERAFDFLIDLAGRPPDGEVAPVHGGAESTGEDDCVKIFGIKFGQIQNIAAGDAGRFRKNVAVVGVAGNGGGFAGKMVDGLGLPGVGRKALIRAARLVYRQLRADGLVDFAAVKNAATRQDNGKSRCFHNLCLLCSELLQ